MIVPFTLSLIGAVYTSPSGILQSPAHLTAGIFLIEKVISVPLPLILTLSALSMRLTRLSIALPILA